VLTVAYLANQFPSNVEPYVGEEIQELRTRGIRVIASSVRTVTEMEALPEIVLQRAGFRSLARAMWLCLTKSGCILPLLTRIAFSGSEDFTQRLKAAVHTFLGACYAEMLQGRGIDHIHAHHGYFGSWIGLTAARLLNVGFSMTLHGSDLLVNARYLDVKLANCDFCITISEYNRNYILTRFPQLDPQKVILSRLGVEAAKRTQLLRPRTRKNCLKLLSAGRLHKVKDHVFLLRACAELLARGVPFECRVAGEGPERQELERLIQKLGLQRRVTLLGQVARERLDPLYEEADVLVLTSRSEGIPLVLMEAMARGTIVLAPAITGIPELVVTGETGFLYRPGSLDDCVAQLQLIHSMVVGDRSRQSPAPFFSCEAASGLDEIRRSALAHIRQSFDRKKNLEAFGDLFRRRICAGNENRADANFILQQI
jgi:colanic acid/amylovoran biosynthesis glycosyltransferase